MVIVIRYNMGLSSVKCHSKFQFVCRLAEKKATIGYTYEDSTVAELGDSPDKLDDEDSDDESKSDEDEVIPDIGLFYC